MATFEQKVRVYTPKLLGAIPQWGTLDACAAWGNAGAESGMQAINEKRPVVKGSRGGYHWFQWTGPRRRALEAFAKQKGLSLDSDELGLQFLVHELKGTERRTVAAVAAAQGLEAKTKAFEQAFERAGVKRYPERLKWAQRAEKALAGNVVLAPPDVPAAAPGGVNRVAVGAATGLAAVILAVIAYFGGLLGG